MNPQTTLRIPIEQDVALLTADFVGSWLGQHVDQVMQAVDDGSLPFVFDLGAGSKNAVRELRIWRECLTDPDRSKLLQADPCGISTVINEVIGTHSADVRGAALETGWRISNQTIRRLLLSGEIRGRISKHTLWLERGSLVSFLQRRRVL